MTDKMDMIKPWPELDPDERSILEQFCARIEIEFCDLAWLRAALTVRSWVNEHRDENWLGNGRLEFLGDAVLDLAIADFLYCKYPNREEGDLTVMRAGLVSEAALARIGRRWGIGALLFVGAGDEKNGARKRAATISDAVEAILAAYYMDAQVAGLDPLARTSQLVHKLWGDELVFAEELLAKDSRSELQEQVQSDLRVTPRYHIDDTGRGAKCLVSIEWNGEQIELGSALGRSQREARQKAAKDALESARWRTLIDPADGTRSEDSN